MFGERPLLLPLLALATGLTCADVFGIFLPLSAVAAALCCLVLSCLIHDRRPLIVCVFLFYLVWGLYALAPWKMPATAPPAILNHVSSRIPVIVEGTVQFRPVATTGNSSLVLKVDKVIRDGISEKTGGNLMIYVAHGDLPVARGDRVRCMTRIFKPHRLGLPGEFDYPRYLAFHEIAATGRVDSAGDIVLIRGAARDSLLRRMDLIALHLSNFIRSSVPQVDASSVLTALLIGDQKRIPVQLADAYTRAGVNHILSISGFHVGIIVFFVVQLAMLATTRFEFLVIGCNLRRAVLLLSLPAMAFYLFLTGASPAMARSVVMLVAFVLAMYSERETDPVNVLLLSAFLLVAINPPTLFDISFQLSFLALWGIIITVTPAMERFSAIQSNWARTLTQFIIASCAASFVTAIPALFVFNQASLNGIISNFLIVPLLGYGAVLAGFFALPFIYIYAPAADLLLWLAAKMVLLSNWLIMLFAKMPLLTFHGVTSLDMLLFLATLSTVTFVRAMRWKVLVSALLPLLAVVIHLSGSPAADNRLHITMLSVGQGESILLRLPDGSNMLVDGGGYLHENGLDFGERTLAPALYKLGIRRIDRMVLTHSHPDHIGGLPFVAQMFPVGEFWEAAPGGVGKQYERLRATLAERRTATRLLGAGDMIALPGGISMSVLSPSWAISGKKGQKGDDMVKDTVDDMDMNEDSLVFRLAYIDTSILFTADSGFPAEKQILRSSAGISANVLKVGHHGSRHSTSEVFLGRVAPELALISAGRNNTFGLPSSRTLNLLEKRGIRTYRTDLDGSIELVSDGKNWTVSTPYRAD